MYYYLLLLNYNLMSKRYSKYLPAFIFFCDLILLNIALYNSHLITFNTYRPQNASAIFIIVVNIAWMLVSLASKSFYVKRPLVLKDNINTILLTLIYHLLVVFGVIYFFKIYFIFCIISSLVLIIYFS